MVGEHGIQTFAVVIIMLLLLFLGFDDFCPHKCISLTFLYKWFIRICLYVGFFISHFDHGQPPLAQTKLIVWLKLWGLVGGQTLRFGMHWVSDESLSIQASNLSKLHSQLEH